MNTPIPEDKLAGIKEALAQNRKIDAIKLYREYTDTGLAEAKAAVEKLEADLRAESPQKSTAEPSRKGCFGVVVVVCVISALAALWLASR